MHKIGIIMGSDSDLRIMREAAQTCAQFHIAHEVTIVSAHRTPERLLDYGKTATARGLRVIIAGAGGAAHLPGMIAAVTPLPVIGVPIHSSNSIDGWDSVLSILQMPAGVPVATVARAAHPRRQRRNPAQPPRRLPGRNAAKRTRQSRRAEKRIPLRLPLKCGAPYPSRSTSHNARSAADTCRFG